MPLSVALLCPIASAGAAVIHGHSSGNGRPDASIDMLRIGLVIEIPVPIESAAAVEGAAVAVVDHAVVRDRVLGGVGEMGEQEGGS